MNSRIKELAFAAASGLRLPRLRQRIAMRDRLTILMYHAVIRSPLAVNDWCFLPEASFRAQMRYVREHFDVLPLGEATKRLREGSIRRPTASITFDDGFHNNYDAAFPILQETGLPATIFLTTDLIDTDETIWFCRLHEAVMGTRRGSLTWDGTVYDLSNPRSKSDASAYLQESMKNLTSETFERSFGRLLQVLDYDARRSIERESPFRILSNAAIKKMAASGLIDFGAHTRTHRILSGLSENECSRDILGSLVAVSRITERPCLLFAYPNGQSSDYTRHAVRTLGANGVIAAVTTRPGPNDSRTPPLELRRYGIGSETTPARFQVLAHHFLAS